MAMQASTPLIPSASEGKLKRAKRVIGTFGPGLMVCLADSDIGGLFTMSVAGSRFGYSLLSLQLMLIPVLYTAQYLSVVLGVCTGRSLVGLANDQLGCRVASLLAFTCTVVGATAVVSELSGIAVVGQLIGLSSTCSCTIAAFLLIAIVVAGDYRFVERVGLCLGACLSVFLISAVIVRPPWVEVADKAVTFPTVAMLESLEVRQVIMANIGTVVTPWMLFYHMSAVTEKKMTSEDLPVAALDTAVGCVVTQLVMCSVLVTFAATSFGLNPENMPLHEVFIRPLQPLFGEAGATLCVSCGLLGASFLASLVVSLGVAWNIADFLGEVSPLKQKVRDAPWFYMGFGGTVMSGAFFVFDQISIVTLNLGIQVLNGLTMPLVVSVLFYLATKPGLLPEEQRVKGAYAWCAGILLLTCAVLAMWMSLQVVPQVTNSLVKSLKAMWKHHF